MSGRWVGYYKIKFWDIDLSETEVVQNEIFMVQNWYKMGTNRLHRCH